MIGFILSGHGEFASGLYSSLKLIAGEQEDFIVINFVNGCTSEQLSQKLIEGINKLAHCDHIVVFTDIAGGTPFNEAAKLSVQHNNVSVLSGTNLPTVLEGIFNRKLDVKEFLDKVVKAGKNSFKSFNKGDF